LRSVAESVVVGLVIVSLLGSVHLVHSALLMIARRPSVVNATFEDFPLFFSVTDRIMVLEDVRMICYPDPIEVKRMTDAVLDPPMTDEKPKTLSVKLRIQAIETARIVAAYRNETLTDLISDIVEPILARMEKEEVAKRNKPSKGKGEPKL
jgi:hypothetical protein